MLVEIAVHDGVDGEAVPEFHLQSCEERDENDEGALEQRQHRPLVVVIVHVPRRPDRADNSEYPQELVPQACLQLRAGIPDPLRIGLDRDLETPELCDGPGIEKGYGGRQNQPRGPAKGTLGHGLEGARVVALPRELQRLECDDETGQEGEYWHADSPLPRNAEDWDLEQAGRVRRAV